MHFPRVLFYDEYVNLRSRPVIVIAIAILTIAAVASLAIWTLRSSNEPATQPPSFQSPAPTQAATSGPCKNFETLAYAKYPISCIKAVELALEQAPGKVQKVSIGPIRAPIPLPAGGVEKRTVNMWLIDIALDNPYVDLQFFGDKEINILQVGIRTEENNLIYKKPL